MHIYFLVPPATPIRRPGAPAAYPFFDLYPAHSTTSPVKVVDAHPRGYPYIALYSTVAPVAFVKRPNAPIAYPFFDLYPAAVKRAGIKILNAPTVYPHFDLYPAWSSASAKAPSTLNAICVRLDSFSVYPAIVVCELSVLCELARN
jgi:hypothetical protein